MISSRRDILNTAGVMIKEREYFQQSAKRKYMLHVYRSCRLSSKFGFAYKFLEKIT